MTKTKKCSKCKVAKPLADFSAQRARPSGLLIKPGIVRHTETPAHLQAYLTKIGGVNLFGEPCFRLKWSGDCLRWDGKPRYRQPARQERWIIEVYRPATWPGYGSREIWETTYYTADGVPVIDKGPFPTRGDWEYLDTVESVDADGNRDYLMPTEEYLLTVVNLFNILLATPQRVIDEKTSAQDEAKRDGDYQYILERVKMATDPSFRNPMVAFANQAHLDGSADNIARSADALMQ